MDEAEQAVPAGTAAGQALAVLRRAWGEWYRVGRDAGHGWHARRRDGRGGLITAPGPDALHAAVAEDFAALPVAAHEAVPVPGSAYSVDTGLPANLANAWCYPVEAVCGACSGRIVLGRLLPGGPDGEWRHEDRGLP